MPRIARGTNAGKSISPQLNLFIEKEDEIIGQLRMIDISSITPLDALNKLSELKNKI
jgi:DNA mismatch repair protein MutS